MYIFRKQVLFLKVSFLKKKKKELSLTLNCSSILTDTTQSSPAFEATILWVWSVFSGHRVAEGSDFVWMSGLNDGEEALYKV